MIVIAANANSEAYGNPEDVLHEPTDMLESLSREQIDGIWLERLTADVALLIRSRRLDCCWRWQEWPERDDVMPEGTAN